MSQWSCSSQIDSKDRPSLVYSHWRRTDCASDYYCPLPLPTTACIMAVYTGSARCSTCAASNTASCAARQSLTTYSTVGHKKKLRVRVEGHNGASPAPAGAHRGGLDRGQGCQARPRGQHRREHNTGTKIPPARQPDARPSLHRALLPSADHTCQSSGSRHGM